MTEPENIQLRILGALMLGDMTGREIARALMVDASLDTPLRCLLDMHQIEELIPQQTLDRSFYRITKKGAARFKAARVQELLGDVDARP